MPKVRTSVWASDGYTPSDMSRSVWVACILVFVCSWSIFGYKYPYYHLTPWRYGAIAWIGEEPADPSFFITRLDRTLDRVFAFWGLDPIEPHPRWAEPQLWKQWMGSTERLFATSIRDYVERTFWKLPAPSWSGEPIWPLVVVVYPDRETFRQLTGSKYAGWFSFGQAGLPGPRKLLYGLPALLVVHLTTSEATLAHELTHWLTYQSLTTDAVWIGDLPLYLLEGMAEVCERLFPRPDGDRFMGSGGRWGSTVLDMVAESCLTEDLFPLAMYVLGESFVAYLIEQWGVGGFWANLPAWAEMSGEFVELHEPDWRESLGLPPECGIGAE